MRLLNFFLPCIIFSSIQLFGAAWVQEKGKGFASFEIFTYSTAKYYDIHRNIVPTGNYFKKLEENFYIEYGLTKKLTVSAKILYATIHQQIEGKTEGFEDFEFACKREVFKKDVHAVAIQALTVIPGGPGNKPVLRYARLAGELDLMYSRSFKIKERYGFFNTELGYRVYQGYPSDQIRGAISTGYDFLKHFQVITALNLEYGVFNGRPRFNSINNVLQNPDYRLLKFDITGRVKLTEKWSAVFGWYKHIWGQNVGSNGGVHGGMWIEF